VKTYGAVPPPSIRLHGVGLNWAYRQLYLYLLFVCYVAISALISIWTTQGQQLFLACNAVTVYAFKVEWLLYVTLALIWKYLCIWPTQCIYVCSRHGHRCQNVRSNKGVTARWWNQQEQQDRATKSPATPVSINSTLCLSKLAAVTNCPTECRVELLWGLLQAKW
jgi:hypothetical protein